MGNFGEFWGIMGTKYWALSEIKGGISHNYPKLSRIIIIQASPSRHSAHYHSIFEIDNGAYNMFL